MALSQALVYMLVSLTIMYVSVLAQTSNTLRVMSYNVRYDSAPDNTTVQETIEHLSRYKPRQPLEYYENTSEKPWSLRRIHVANDILLRDIDVYGGQELLKRQVLDLEELLGTDFAWVGVGRDDGKQKGEFSAIFFNRNTIQLGDWDTFWLTDSPFDVSKYPDAGSYRTATTAHFVGSGKSFTMINTHLDDQSVGQRQLGASLILHRAKYEAIKNKRPVIVTGDFNSPSTDVAYQVLTGTLRPTPLNKTFTDKYSWTDSEGQNSEDFVLKDLLYETPPHRCGGNYATFTDFAAADDTSNFKRLDYILGGSNGGWIAESYHVGTNLYDNGVYASDHRPVHADLRFANYFGFEAQNGAEL